MTAAEAEAQQTANPSAAIDVCTFRFIRSSCLMGNGTAMSRQDIAFSNNVNIYFSNLSSSPPADSAAI
jgi:hypothetical protein